MRAAARGATRSAPLFVLLLSLTACAASTARAPETRVTPNQDTGLAGLAGSVVDIGSEVREYLVPFTLSSIPEPAALQLRFGVVRAGRCPITYRPTTVALNGTSLAILDFRTLKRHAETDLRVPIPSGALKVGENILLIRTGFCQYDIDVMRLNTLTLLQR
jgi:hypothetical protein